MISKNIKETNKIAQVFFKRILKKKNKHPRALIVCLSGDLGAGKTVFVRAIAKYLNIKNKINSPTFVVVKKYLLKKNTRFKFLFHLDAYRLENEKGLIHLGWEDIIKNKEHLVFIEWPENIIKSIPSRSNFIYISSKKNGDRHFKLK